MRHGDVWRGLDLLARNHGLTASGLAKLAGLDATAFNKSKRSPEDGRPRWPSTESLSRVLDAVGVDLVEFAELVAGRRKPSLPHCLHTDPELGRFVDPAKRALVQSRETVEIVNADAACLVEVASDEFAPNYQTGDRLIVSSTASLAPGARVMIRRKAGDVEVQTLVSRTPSRFELRPLSGAGRTQSVSADDIDWIVRILWVSQ